MGSLIGFHRVADQLSPVDPVNDNFFVDLQIEWRLLRLVLIADQLEISLPEDNPPFPPVFRSLNPVRQVIP